MSIELMLRKEHSKEQTNLIAQYIDNKETLFKELLVFFLGEDELLAQRAAWAMRTCIERNPQWLEQRLGIFINNLKKEKIHVAVQRNTLKMLETVEIPEELMGEIYDVCFKNLENIKSPIAIKVFSMQILCNICMKEPELAEELITIIEEQYPHSSAGYKSRARKVLKALRKL